MFHMETNRLRQFCIIAETGSMTNAARLLHISHSGLSKSMKLLQEEAGCVLLRPAGRGLALTEAGLEIYRRAKEFIQQEERLFELNKSPVPSTLRIGALEIFLLPLGAALKHHLLESSTLALLDFDPGNMEQSIANHQLDFGITHVPFPMERVEIIEIGQYRSGCYHLRGAFEGQNLTSIPFVAPECGFSSNPLGIKELDGWPENFYPRNKKYLVNLLSTAIQITLQGLCAIYIPDFLAYQINKSHDTVNMLVEYPLTKKQKILQRVFLLKNKENENTVICEHLCQVLRKIIAKED